MLIQTPVYSEFYDVTEGWGREVVESPLVETDGNWSVDFEDFEEKAKELMAMQVKDIAKKQVISVTAEMELGEVCQILTENHIKKAPVLENGKMIGIINMSNITKYVLQKMM